MDVHARLIRIQEARRRLDGADVVSNFYSEREGDSPRKKVQKKVGKLSPQERLLLRQMQMQSATALGKTRAKHGSDIVPQPPSPKPINFQAEAVEARYKRLKKAQDKKIASDPRVGLHGPSHPMFHRSDLAKRVRQLSTQLKNKPRGKSNG